MDNNKHNENNCGKLIITSFDEQFEIAKEEYRAVLKRLRAERRWKIFAAIGVAVFFAMLAISGLMVNSCVNGNLSCSSCSWDKKKYSLDNISISVIKKENDIEKSMYINGKTVGVYFYITNNSTEILSEISGEMKVYLGEDDYVMTWNISLTERIEAGDSKQLIVKCDAASSDAMDKFYNASTEELKLTYVISYVYFGTTASDIKQVEDKSGEERVIKPYGKLQGGAI